MRTGSFPRDRRPLFQHRLRRAAGGALGEDWQRFPALAAPGRDLGDAAGSAEENRGRCRLDHLDHLTQHLHQRRVAIHLRGDRPARPGECHGLARAPPGFRGARLDAGGQPPHHQSRQQEQHERQPLPRVPRRHLEARSLDQEVEGEERQEGSEAGRPTAVLDGHADHDQQVKHRDIGDVDRLADPIDHTRHERNPHAGRYISHQAR